MTLLSAGAARRRRVRTRPASRRPIRPPAGSGGGRVRGAALVPLVVLAPLVALAPTADHRFNLYWHGGLFRDDPLRIVPHTLRLGAAVPDARQLPAARPDAGEVAGPGRVHARPTSLGVPVNVAFRLVSFAGRGRADGRRRCCSPRACVAPRPAVRPGAVDVGRDRAVRGRRRVRGGRLGQPAVLFGGLYLLSAALVLGVAARGLPGADRRGRLVAGAVAGARRRRAGRVQRDRLSGAAARHRRGRVRRPGGAGLDVAASRYRPGGPDRSGCSGSASCRSSCRSGLVIRGYCAARRLLPGFGPRGRPGVPWPLTGPDGRLAAAADVARRPPGGTHRPWLVGVVAVLALLVLGRAGLARGPRPAAPPAVDRRQAYGAGRAPRSALLVLGATLGSLNADVQELVARRPLGAGLAGHRGDRHGGRALLLAAVLPARSGPGGWRCRARGAPRAGRDGVHRGQQELPRPARGPAQPALLADRLAGGDGRLRPDAGRRRPPLRAAAPSSARCTPTPRSRCSGSTSPSTWPPGSRPGVPFCEAAR